jgi:hypothetical protein
MVKGRGHRHKTIDIDIENIFSKNSYKAMLCYIDQDYFINTCNSGITLNRDEYFHL